MEEYKDQLSYVLGDEAEASQEEPVETQETETPSEAPEETPEETQEQSETKEESQETEESQEEPKEEPQETEEEQQEQKEHLTRSQKRKLYFQRLEEENRKLKEAQKKNLPWNQDGEVKELTQEEFQEMVKKEVEAVRQAEKQEQIREEWASDYQQALEKYPELNPESKEYNQELDQLLTDLLTDGDGNPKLNIKVSQAYERMRKSLDVAKTQGAQDASLKLAKQKEESALAPSATGEETKAETWEDFQKLQVTDPETYYERIKKGDLPPEE